MQLPRALSSAWSPRRAPSTLAQRWPWCRATCCPHTVDPTSPGTQAAGVAAMAHLDRPDCAEEAMVVLMRAMGTHAAAMGGSAASGVSAPGSPSAPVLLPDLRLLVCGAHQAGSPDCREMVTGVVMGFAACLAELDQLHGPHAERDPTWWMRCDAGALAAALRPAVELLCVLRANEGPDGRPRSYGLALDLQTGAAWCVRGYECQGCGFQSGSFHDGSYGPAVSMLAARHPGNATSSPEGLGFWTDMRLCGCLSWVSSRSLNRQM